MNFAQFLEAYDDLVKRARTNKLTVADFEGTTISLTNPGTVGTVGSIPRLMPGQGAIIATGAIDYPPEYRGVPEEVRTSLGLSKVMTVTCTYDHRVIQGAESGMFLGAPASAAGRRRRFLRRDLLRSRDPHSSASLGAGSSRRAGCECRSREASRRRAADPSLAGARAPDCGYRSARRPAPGVSGVWSRPRMA